MNAYSFRRCDKVLILQDVILRKADSSFAENVAKYYLRNKVFLENFEPTREAEFFTKAHQHALLQQEMQQAETKAAFRFYIFPNDAPENIIGSIGLNNIVWGSFCSCFLGYKLDAQYCNRGYMTQCVSAVSHYAFAQLQLHRIEANVMPRNAASLRVLQKCGFENEGLSKRYLKIHGVWEDHIHMVKLSEEQ